MRFLEHLPHITAVMSERSDGPMGPGGNGDPAENRKRFLEANGFSVQQMVLAGLTDGIAVRVLTTRGAPRDGVVPNTDGLLSFGPDIGLRAQDCFSLFFAPSDPSDGIEFVGLVHAGWRGILGGIIAVVGATLSSRGIDPRHDLEVAIGPGIRQCCYVVRDDENGWRQYLDRGYERFVEEIEPDAVGRRFRVDLAGILLYQLTTFPETSIPASHITVAEECTYCTRNGNGTYRFASWRRDGLKGANMLSAIRMTTKRGMETIEL